LCDYFNEAVAVRIKDEYGSAAVIHANNVMAHLEELHSFVDGIRVLLALDGLMCIEVAYVKDMVVSGSFDQIYHEHLCYYSLGTIERLFQEHDLSVFDAERIPAHGGSLRIYAGHPGEHYKTQALQELRAMEEREGVNEESFYKSFGGKVTGLKTDLCNLLHDMKRQGKTIVVYGVAAKATVLLNYFGLGTDVFEYAADRSSEKQGRTVPGPNLLVCPPEQIDEDKPDVILITAWNYANEIMDQLFAHQARGGIFIVPLPELKVIG
jgi:hypothetical protein